MRKHLLGLIILCLLVGWQKTNASIIQIAAPADVSSYVNNAADGDIIELTTAGGAYTWGNSITVSTEKALTVRAASGLSTRPVITNAMTVSTYMLRNSFTSTSTVTKSWTFDGIEVNGYNQTYGSYAAYFYYSYLNSTSTYGMNINANNCAFKSFSSRVFHYSGLGSIGASAQGGDLIVSNTEFTDLRYAVLYQTSSATNLAPNNISFSNCLFIMAPGVTSTTGYINIGSLLSSNYNSLVINHCTFKDSYSGELNIAGTPRNTFSIKNSIFSNSVNTGSYVNNFGGLSLGTDCGVYYTGAGSASTIYPNSSLAKTSNPVFDANYVATASSYVSAGTDGKTIGYNCNNISAPSSLDNFRYIVGSGPSTEQSFSLNANGLTSNLTITAPSSYQISVLSGVGFSNSLTLAQSGGMIAPTTVYVRLKSGLAIGNYTGNITLSSTKSSGAFSQTIALNGNVTSTPSLTTSVSSITGITGYSYATSTPKSFLINATALTSPVILTIPYGLQVSTDSLSGFTGGSLTISPVNDNLVNKKVFVRMDVTYFGTYSGNITISSTGFSNRSIVVTGWVFNLPVTNVSNSSLSGFNYFTNAGTASAIQSFTVSGSYLVSPITITAPDNYEISSTGGSSFSGKTSLTLTPDVGTVGVTTLYVRLKSSLAANTYTGNISISTTDIPTKTIAVTGTVSSPPVLSSTKSSINYLDYQIGAGPSAIQSFNVSGNYLTSAVLVSAPTNFEISTTGGTSFNPSSSIVLPNSNGVAGPTTIYVRMKAGLAAGSYTDKITIASTGATDVQMTLNGTVSVPTIDCSVASISLNKYIIGNGPSASSSFNFIGQNLSAAITITAPTNFELSTNNITFVSTISVPPTSGTILSTIIYVRLKSNLSIGTYAGSIILSTTNAANKTIPVSGNVNDIARISQALGGFEYAINAGPSKEQVIIISGSDLNGNIVATPPANFEISAIPTTQGGIFSSSSLSITPINTAVSGTKIYVRLKAGLAVNAYSGNLTLQSTGASSITVPLIGNVSLSTANMVPSENPITVITTPGNMKVSGTSGGETIEVYNSNGMKVKTVQAEGSETNIPTQGKNVYIIKVITK